MYMYICRYFVSSWIAVGFCRHFNPGGVETLTVSGTLIFNQATWGCWDLDGQPRLTAFGLPLLVLRLAVDQLTLL